MKKIFAIVIVATLAIFGFGFGQNYLARINAEDAVATAARRAELIENLESVVQEYCETQPELTAHIRTVDINDDGVTLMVSGWNGDEHFADEVEYTWSELVEVTNDGVAYTQAALYSR